MNIFLVGYFGFGNLGDDLILGKMQFFLNSYFSKAKVFILGEAKGLKYHYPATYIKRKNIFKILTTLAKADLILFPGGGLWQDSTGRGLSAFFYGSVAKVAYALNKPVLFFNQEIDLFNKKFIYRYLNRVLKKAHYVSLRDTTPTFILDQMFKGYHVFPDSLLTLEKKEKTDPLVGFVSTDILGLALTNKLSKKIEAIIINEIKKQTIKKIILFSFFPKQDKPVADRFQALLGSSVKVEVVWGKAILAQLTQCAKIIGMRYHSLVLAANFQVPFLGIAAANKIERFCNKFKQPWLTLDEPQAASIIEGFFTKSTPFPKNYLQEAAAQVNTSYSSLKKAIEICVT